MFKSLCKHCLILGAVGLGSFLTITRAEPPDTEVILITGFEPFGEKSVNSSWEAVRQFDGLILEAGRRIVTLQLPVVWETAADILYEAIDEHVPVLVLSVGQGSEIIRLERNAHNENGQILDNAGKLPASEVIVSGSSDVYSTSFDVDAMVTELASTNISVSASESAGRYLCNFISYHAYDYLARVRSDTRMLFVHVPPILNVEDAKLTEIVTALDAIVRQTSAETPVRAAPLRKPAFSHKDFS